jgi:hypothetical protein
MKKATLCIVLSLFAFMLGFSAIVDYIPADASFAMVLRDNAKNYAGLKQVGIFGFLLRDMGIESMIAQQFESIKYTDPEFVPSNFWGLLGGDIAAFAQGDVDLSALGELMNVGMMGSDPSEALPEALDMLKEMNAAIIIKPAGDPETVIKTWNKVLGMEIAWGEEPMTGIMVEKDNGYIIFSTNRNALEVAKNAKSANILTNSIFAEEYQSNNWMVMYFENDVDPTSIINMLEENVGISLPESVFEGSEMDYSLSTLKVTDVLQFNNYNKYTFTDLESKQFAVNANKDMLSIYKTTSLPGSIQGIMEINQMEKILPEIESVFNIVIKQLVEKEEVSETELEDINKIFNIIKGIEGKAKLGLDISLDESLNPIIDIYFNTAMKTADELKALLINEEGVEFQDISGYSGATIMSKEIGDDLDLNLYLGKDGITITSMKADQLGKISSLPVLMKNTMFAELANKYSFKNGIGMLFIDIGSILTKILGVAYPSGLFVEMGTDETGSSRMIAVIK